MNERAIAFYAILIGGTALSLARCSDSPMVPSTIVPCPALAVVGPDLVSPSPGATGVPTAAGTLTLLLRNGTFLAHTDVRLAPGNGSALDLGTLNVPSPAPTATATTIAIAYPMLASATTYTVTYTDISGSRCPLPISNGGSFTTQ